MVASRVPPHPRGGGEMSAIYIYLRQACAVVCAGRGLGQRARGCRMGAISVVAGSEPGWGRLCVSLGSRCFTSPPEGHQRQRPTTPQVRCAMHTIGPGRKALGWCQGAAPLAAGSDVRMGLLRVGALTALLPRCVCDV